MCPQSFLCRLCLCSSTEVKELVNKNGRYNDIYEISAKYFDPLLLTTVICVDCWQHIYEFYEFQQCVFKAQSELEDVKEKVPIVKTELIIIEQDKIEIVPTKEVLKDDDLSLFDSVNSNDYNPFSSDDEAPLAEYSNKNVSPINSKEENMDPIHRNASRNFQFKCIVCEKRFRYIHLLRAHSVEHNFKCPICSKTISQYRNVSRHIKTKHPKEYVELGYDQPDVLQNLYTKLKQETMLSANDDDDDNNRDSDEITFKCPYCPDRVKQQRNLRRHIKGKHPEKFNDYISIIQKLKETVESDDNDVDDGKFKCPYCRRKYTQKKNIGRHIKVVHPEKYVEPSIDFTKAVDLNSLGRHVGKDDAMDEEELPPNYDDYDAFISKWKPEIECYVCQNTFTKYCLFRQHFRDEHPTDKCHIECCEYRIRTRVELVDHIRIHLDPNSFKCDICGKCLPHRHSLKSHKERNHVEKNLMPSFTCNICQKSFISKGKLSTHVGIHSNEKRYFCNECNKGFSTKKILKKHGYTHTRNHLCDQCGKSFQSNPALEKHLLEHDDNYENVDKGGDKADRRWPCDICGSLLKSELTLNSHKRTCHNNDTVFVCSECNKVYSSKLSLKNHKKTAHGYGPERKFECPTCQKVLLSAHSLREHKAIHFGGDRFPCPYCSLVIKQKKNLPRHIKLAHPTEVSISRRRTKLTLVDKKIVIV